MFFKNSEHKNKAFTLAEVLITLLIIGIVASLVIPAIIQNTQDAEFKVAYKKAYAMAELATKQAVSNYLFVPRNGTYDTTSTLYNFNVFKSQFSVARECINNNVDQCWDSTGELACTGACGGMNGGYPNNYVSRAFIDNSGMAWTLYSYNEDIIMVDTNGSKSPNRYGKDRWIFVFKTHNNTRITVGLPYKIAPYYTNDATSSDVMACHYPPCYFISWLKE